MRRSFTLEYWEDDGWFVGCIREIPGVFSQGETLEELENNVRDAYRLMLEEEGAPPHANSKTKEIGVEV